MSTSASETGCHPRGDSVDNICVLGIGNLLWADEGFGVRCVQAIEQGWVFAPHVSLVDGGTQGLYLIHHVQSASRLLIFDAIDYGLEPGTIKLVRNEDVPRFLGAKKMSLHQTGFQEVLSLAQLTGHYPAEVLLIGCQPQELEDYGGSLRPVVKEALQRALSIALDELGKWGACPRRRVDVPEDEAKQAHGILAMSAYEMGRPSADAACRTGDERFFPQSSQEEER
ncbi:MAG: hydrogenase 1 maturation protease [Rhodospirillaceae bacterium]|jgi:hydrogenase maturation protease|nr:MAG: hydrogenase 1 maturation protease [Rhodospirillaceae bacterium]HBH39174.1 hydrogenase expression/formation protein [Curvibacter sp.]